MCQIIDKMLENRLRWFKKLRYRSNNKGEKTIIKRKHVVKLHEFKVD